MQKKTFTIDDEIEKTLACIDKIERIEINPWLPTRFSNQQKKESLFVEKFISLFTAAKQLLEKMKSMSIL